MCAIALLINLFSPHHGREIALDKRKLPGRVKVKYPDEVISNPLGEASPSGSRVSRESKPGYLWGKARLKRKQALFTSSIVNGRMVKPLRCLVTGQVFGFAPPSPGRRAAGKLGDADGRLSSPLRTVPGRDIWPRGGCRPYARLRSCSFFITSSSLRFWK
jgi:hypothetical protein